MESKSTTSETTPAADLVPKPEERLIGVLNGEYRLVRLLGEGTTSRVYLAFRAKDELPVAIKIFKAEFLNSFPGATEIFANELTVLLTLDHPNIIKIYDYKIDGRIVGEGIDMGGVWFIALEYISQSTLIDVVKFHLRLSESNAKYFFTQMVSTLTYINS
jgi:BR serine/threonine kinase